MKIRSKRIKSIVGIILAIIFLFSDLNPDVVAPVRKENEIESVRVERVIDGDTIKLQTGETVRYIGIDTPETVHPNKPVMCFGSEASQKNKELVIGKTIRLEKDVSETDTYGRLLRYVWVGDMLVNEYLVREGFAVSSTFPPDVKYQDRLIAAQQMARDQKKGLWGDACDSL